MLNFYNLIIYSVIILIAASSPIPTAPLLLTSYRVNGIIGGFIVACFGGIGSGLFHYYLGKFFLNFLMRKRFRNTYKKVLKLSKRIRKVSFVEIIILMLPNYIPSLIKCAACGAARVNLKYMIFACLISQIPTQLIFILVSSKVSIIENSFLKLTNNKSVSFLLAICLASLISFFIIIIIRLFPKFIKLFKKNLKNFFTF